MNNYLEANENHFALRSLMPLSHRITQLAKLTPVSSLIER